MAKQDPNIGRMMAGRYRLDELLGRGGFGSVYSAYDTLIEREVAVKLLNVTDSAHTEAQKAELRERFRLEATAAGRVEHPNVVTIYDVGIPEEANELFLVMELLRGHDLGEELELKGPVEPRRALRLFVPCLEALGMGHQLGIVHKDIKPQNVFIRHPGEPSESFCLVDYGVARVMHEDRLTMTGLIVGTPQYMAPEYITDAEVTPALDVYQMGLILAEAITGVPAVPRNESFVKSCNRHFTGDLDIPEELFDGPFGDVLGKALEPIAKKRFANATEFARRLLTVDPDTISLDFKETIVFVRPERDVPTLDEAPKPSLFPPMKPDEVSAELARQSGLADVVPPQTGAVPAPNTPTGLQFPDEFETLDDEVDGLAETSFPGPEGGLSAVRVAAGGVAPDKEFPAIDRAAGRPDSASIEDTLPRRPPVSESVLMEPAPLSEPRKAPASDEFPAPMYGPSGAETIPPSSEALRGIRGLSERSSSVSEEPAGDLSESQGLGAESSAGQSGPAPSDLSEASGEELGAQSSAGLSEPSGGLGEVSSAALSEPSTPGLGAGSLSEPSESSVGISGTAAIRQAPKGVDWEDSEAFDAPPRLSTGFLLGVAVSVVVAAAALAVGAYALWLNLEGEAEPALDAAVEPTSITRVVVTPPGAEVWLDGRRLGPAPLDLPSSDAGSRQIELRKDGFVTSTHAVSAGEAVVSLTMKPVEPAAAVDAGPPQDPPEVDAPAPTPKPKKTRTPPPTPRVSQDQPTERPDRPADPEPDPPVVHPTEPDPPAADKEKDAGATSKPAAKPWQPPGPDVWKTKMRISN